MNVDDAVDAPRHRLAHVVLLGLMNAILVE